jgi:hypothetical protein
MSCDIDPYSKRLLMFDGVMGEHRTNTSSTSGGHYQLTPKKGKEKLEDLVSRGLGVDILNDLGTSIVSRNSSLKYA